MFLEEKIDLFIKERNLSNKEFRVPFTDWSLILKKIESSFFADYDYKYPQKNWKSRLFNLTISSLEEVHSYIKAEKEYWIILTKSTPIANNFVYSCKGDLINQFVNLTKDDYYIIDKKYVWLIFCERENESYYLAAPKSKH